MKFSYFLLSKYIVNIITCCILLYSLHGYCHGLRTFKWLNQFSTSRGEVEPNPCGWKVLASCISKAPLRETPTILSFFDNISPLPEICGFSKNYPLAKSFNLIPMSEKSTEFFQSIRIFPTSFLRNFWESHLGTLDSIKKEKRDTPHRYLGAVALLTLSQSFAKGRKGWRGARGRLLAGTYVRNNGGRTILAPIFWNANEQTSFFFFFWHKPRQGCPSTNAAKWAPGV